MYHALSAAMPSEIGPPIIRTPHATVALLLNLDADINIPVSAWPGTTLWRILLHSISAAKSSNTSPRELPYSPPRTPKIVTRPKRAYTVSDMRSLQSGIWRDADESDVLTLDAWLMTLPEPKNDRAIRWHSFTLENICRSICSDTEAKISRNQAHLPMDDASMLELMLHHGADPDEMDTRVLDVFLEQCCGGCQIRFKKSRSEG